MIHPQNISKNSGLMVLSLSLAVMLWLFVNYHKESDKEVMVPVVYENVKPSLLIANQPPKHINVRVTGPRIEMMRLRPDRLKVSVDLADVSAGVVRFTELERLIPFPRKMKVTRIYPAIIEVKLIEKEG